jgi:hypothetical protein
MYHTADVVVIYVRNEYLCKGKCRSLVMRKLHLQWQTEGRNALIHNIIDICDTDRSF